MEQNITRNEFNIRNKLLCKWHAYNFHKYMYDEGNFVLYPLVDASIHINFVIKIL